MVNINSRLKPLRKLSKKAHRAKVKALKAKAEKVLAMINGAHSRAGNGNLIFKGDNTTCQSS